MMCRTLQGHAHWVNTMALSTDYAARIGAWDPAAKKGAPVSNEFTLTSSLQLQGALVYFKIYLRVGLTTTEILLN